MISCSLENLESALSLFLGLNLEKFLLSYMVVFSTLVIPLGCKEGLSHLVLQFGLPQVCFIQVLLMSVFRFPLSGGSDALVFCFSSPLVGTATVSSWSSPVTDC